MWVIVCLGTLLLASHHQTITKLRPTSYISNKLYRDIHKSVAEAGGHSNSQALSMLHFSAFRPADG